MKNPRLSHDLALYMERCQRTGIAAALTGEALTLLYMMLGDKCWREAERKIK